MKVKTVRVGDELVVFCEGGYWRFAAASKTIKEEDAEKICREAEEIVEEIDRRMQSLRASFTVKAEKGWR